MNTESDFMLLKGKEKAAMLMLAIGEENAIKLFQLMENEEITELSNQMASVGRTDSRMIELLFTEFVEALSHTGSITGGHHNTERLLAKALDPERAAMIMDDIRGPAGRTLWDKLANVNEGVLANYLKNEYPQTVAVVLSKIIPTHAAKVLEQLPETLSMEVIMRMLRMEPVKKEILDSIEKTLRTEFMTNLSKSARSDSHEGMAEIFNHLDRNYETRFMSLLEERNQESADRIRALMFTFTDLVNLDNNSMQVLLRNVEQNVLALALKGADDAMRELVTGNMSKRASRILLEDMEAMGPVRIRDVDEAQNKMVMKAKELASMGEIIIADGSDDEQLVY